MSRGCPYSNTLPNGMQISESRTQTPCSPPFTFTSETQLGPPETTPGPPPRTLIFRSLHSLTQVLRRLASAWMNTVPTKLPSGMKQKLPIPSSASSSSSFDSRLYPKPNVRSVKSVPGVSFLLFRYFCSAPTWPCGVFIWFGKPSVNSHTSVFAKSDANLYPILSSPPRAAGGAVVIGGSASGSWVVATVDATSEDVEMVDALSSNS
mmetsp:Transcript_13387/g.32800  ORF Transcript_13387/g.32800 Transcript_13387/m.32800 type:complete len:207 (+) Transcript_13387:2393-3013(+)